MITTYIVTCRLSPATTLLCGVVQADYGQTTGRLWADYGQTTTITSTPQMLSLVALSTVKINPSMKS